MKSRVEEDLEEVGSVAGSDEAFVFESVIVFEQARAGSAEQAEVGGGVAFAEAGLVFMECHVELPMPLLLDAPMAAKRREVSFLLKM